MEGVANIDLKAQDLGRYNDLWSDELTRGGVVSYVQFSLFSCLK